ncbi:oxidoreductase domain protein [Desulfarculus baarsii DSM 2075]|uniref:Oxidoreductase domain protein n=1 Tax=Desulfarculus baarsii (strain ATCC 33931 / DSM 2075 / LMG 7858 / VKM B-1802 / 2st14) TaxID=644282 RepID=E1QIF1_DESB2|nr:Gfo/Idh/MocA family oxidoreductase [Desulfarculus baarsii]ADK85468.1 oxidoreductase domain protein [Desulfarculus baarsii DSM 2075]
MKKVRLAVIGVGYLGRFHAQKIAAMDQAELVAVVDVDLDRAQAQAAEHGCLACAALDEVIDQIDAACVVTPTVYHYDIAARLLTAGKDVLCEKPVTTTLAQADHLVELAAAGGRILQVGHLERFNPAAAQAFGLMTKPMFIECNRIAPFKARAMDVDVALDLMIHDLDIILALVGEEPCEIRAKGVPVLGPHADLVNARLEFPGGCVANVTASRLALKDERKMRIFQPESYMALDFKERQLLVVRGVNYVAGHDPEVDSRLLEFGPCDPLDQEIRSFVDSVIKRTPPLVDGAAARRALACALAVKAGVDAGLRGMEPLLNEPRKWVGAKAPGAC